ncbi:MAG: DUF1592 domain-containing protein [Pedosphaera sp.]|nr:DUF1592 domain-containing protein [Pedosphaera sp.]
MIASAKIIRLLVVLGFTGHPAGGAPSTTEKADRAFTRELTPLFQKYCYDCHGNGKKKGGLALDTFKSLADVQAQRERWENLHENVRTSVMPPENKPQPTQTERDRITDWIERELFKLDPDHPDPGRVTIRRLNRAEYNNTVRDLVGVDLRPADDFPPDDSGYGFDNIGDVLSLPPMLMEKYFAAADKILDRALPTGPAPLPPLTAPMQRYFAGSAGRHEAQARTILGQFTFRAWRRPVEVAELDRLMGLFKLARHQGETFEASVKLAMKAALVSPHFLFRGEIQSQPNQRDSVHPVNEFALATRISYFLWSSTPDDELLDLAKRGRLRKNLPAQVKRMLADARARALVENFAGQWLETRRLSTLQPDKKLFPDYDAALSAAMQRETEMFCESIVRENRSVLDFLSADYSFVNARLARHYGLAGVEGDEFRKVSLKGTPRRGVLTHASVLTLTSNPTRTSPVKRGKWVLENLLGTPPPPPPPDVPALDDKGRKLTGTLREQMVQHRENPACASCHARMDPIGFSLENFNAIGAWREKDGDGAVDASGTLVSGESFRGAAELSRLLAQNKRDNFLRCLSEKMLTFALGRGLEYYDRVATDRIVKQLKSGEARLGSLVLEVVNSAPFQMQRGDEHVSGAR